jgi:hypothetical protein
MSHKSSRVAARLVLASALGICAAAAATRTASADIISTVGLTPITAPSLVTGDFAANGGLPSQLIFAEQQNVLLASPLVTDTGTIAAGTLINSYFFAVNVIQAIPVIVDTSVTFDGDVLGIIYKDPADPYGNPSLPFYPLFTASNFLGASGTTYTLEGASACGPFCGFETISAPEHGYRLVHRQHGLFPQQLFNARRFCAHHHCRSPTSSRPHRWRWTSRSDLGERRPSRLVATAAEDRLNVR